MEALSKAASLETRSEAEARGGNKRKYFPKRKVEKTWLDRVLSTIAAHCEVGEDEEEVTAAKLLALSAGLAEARLADPILIMADGRKERAPRAVTRKVAAEELAKLKESGVLDVGREFPPRVYIELEKDDGEKTTKPLGAFGRVLNPAACGVAVGDVGSLKAWSEQKCLDRLVQLERMHHVTQRLVQLGEPAWLPEEGVGPHSPVDLLYDPLLFVHGTKAERECRRPEVFFLMQAGDGLEDIKYQCGVRLEELHPLNEPLEFDGGQMRFGPSVGTADELFKLAYVLGVEGGAERTRKLNEPKVRAKCEGYNTMPALLGSNSNALKEVHAIIDAEAMPDYPLHALKGLLALIFETIESTLTPAERAKFEKNLDHRR